MAKAMTARACRMQSSTVRRIQEVSTTALQRSVANQRAAESLRGSWRDLAREQRVCFELSAPGIGSPSPEHGPAPASLMTIKNRDCVLGQ
jgi:hypothetical protein